MAVHTGAVVEAITPAGTCLADSETVWAELMPLSTGLRPNEGLATSGPELGVVGSIRVDGRLRTTLPNVYVSGECTQQTRLVTGKPV